jgi:hypothetical protein
MSNTWTFRKAQKVIQYICIRTGMKCNLQKEMSIKDYVSAVMKWDNSKTTAIKSEWQAQLRISEGYCCIGHVACAGQLRKHIYIPPVGKSEGWKPLVDLMYTAGRYTEFKCFETAQRWDFLNTLNMEATCSYETSVVFQRNAWLFIAEDWRENLRSSNSLISPTEQTPSPPLTPLTPLTPPNHQSHCRTTKNSMVWVRERTIPTERPPLIGEVIANFCR